MSSTREVSESAQPNIRDDKYVADKTLVTIPEGWDAPGDLQEPCHSAPTPFPSLKTFVHLASVAYIDHEYDGSFKSTSKDDEEVQLDGFTFLSAAKNSDRLNGYYAVAYVNRDTRQVILSHRGTNPSTLGALWADLKGIVMNSGVPQVSSAMTFAHKVVEYAGRRGYEVFFTGHSLGGWLAQITTFSTIYLTLNEVTGHFVGKPTPDSDIRMPYTVVFDSPGAYEFLFSLKKALFPRHVESTQKIGIEALPVEVYLFHPNPINCVNFQIGRLFILDVEKVGVDTGKYFGAGTHGIGPVVRLLNNWGEDSAVKGRVIDFREGKKDFDSKDGRDRTIPWNKSSVPLYFFSRDERGFLQGAKRDFPPEGQFEGVSYDNEDMANNLISLEDADFRWRLTGGEESVVNCGEWDRREFIPRVRHIVRCLRLRGTLWWNPKKSQLPPNYVERRIAPSERQFSATEVLNEAKTLLLLVDAPGMGKSSAMTKLEMELKSEISSSSRVIVRLNLNQVQDILESHPDNGTTSDTEYVMKFLEKFVKYIPVTLLQQSLQLQTSPLPVYILLDGLDEVCPIYEHIMLHILRSLLFKSQESLFSVQKVVLTTRPHLQLLIEDHFSIEANSLLPFDLTEQTEFLQKEVGPTIDAEKSLESLPRQARSLMENPLMLSLYAEVLKSDGAKGVLNIFDLYSQFMKAKHTLHLVEKQKANPSDQSTKQRVVSMLDDNLKFYYDCAVNEITGPVRTRTSWFKRFVNKRSNFGEELLEEPTGRKLDELISFGVLVGEGDFKHRSFAEFFFAILVADEERTSQMLRDLLLRKMYEHGGIRNIELFLREVLIKRTVEITAVPSQWHSASSVALLREPEASLCLGKKRLTRLVTCWLDSMKYKKGSLPLLFRFMMSPHENKAELRNEDSFPYFSFNTMSLWKVRAEVFVSVNKTDALVNFYNGDLFPFLCGCTVLMSIDYGDPRILRIIRDETRTTGHFVGWLCDFADRDWARRSVSHVNKTIDNSGLSHGHQADDIAKLILLIAMRTDDISKILLNEEISAAIKSVDSVVLKALRMNSVDTTRVRKILEKYVEPQTIKSLLLLFLTKTDASEWDNTLFTLEMSWWVSEVFSRSELLSILTDEATRATEVAGIYPKMVQLAWGEEFTHQRIHFLQLMDRPDYEESKTIFDICANEWETILQEDMQNAKEGSPEQQDYINTIRQAMVRHRNGYGILRRLEEGCIQHSHLAEQGNSCGILEGGATRLTRYLEQIFTSRKPGKANLISLGIPLGMDVLQKTISDYLLYCILEWLPFVIRYSGRSEDIKVIIKHLSLLCKELSPYKYKTAERSLLLAYSCEKNANPDVCQLVRSFIRRLKRNLDPVLNLLLEADEGELRSLIKKHSRGTPPIVTNTPVWKVLVSLMLKKNSVFEFEKETVTRIFIGLIKTSSCCELLEVLKQFHTLFYPDLLKDALMSEKVLKFIKKHWIHFEFELCKNGEFKPTCKTVSVMRYYLFVFGESIRWMECFSKFNVIPVEILLAFDNVEGTPGEIFQPLTKEARLALVTQLDEMFTEGYMIEEGCETLCDFVKCYSYDRESEWEWLLQARQLIPPQPLEDFEITNTVGFVDHGRRKRTQNIVSLIRVWVKHFGVEKTRGAADEQNLWKWDKDLENNPTGEFLLAAVEVGSLKGVKTLAWPGLLRWKNECGKTAGEVAVEIWGGDHEVSKYLEQKFKAARIFQD